MLSLIHIQMCIRDSLKEAVDCLVADEFLCSVLGEHITTKYVEAKMKEWENYTTRVSQWEIDEYLYKY